MRAAVRRTPASSRRLEEGRAVSAATAITTPADASERAASATCAIRRCTATASPSSPTTTCGRVAADGRHRAATDGGALGAVDAVALARRPLARLRRPRRAPSRGPRDAGRRRPVAPPHLARRRRAGARLDAGGRDRLRDDAGPAVLPQSPGVRGRADGRRRRARSASARSTTSPSATAAASRSAATPTTRRAGSATAAAAPARSGSTPKAAARSAASTRSPATSPRRCGSARASTSSATAKASATSTRAAPTAATCAATPTTTSFYARQAQSDGTRIVYACGARLWLFDPGADTTRELAIETPAHRTQAARRFVASAEHLEWFRPHPAGHSLAVVARGQLFAMPLWEGAPTRRDDAVAGRCRDARPGGAAARLRRGQWLADGTTMIAASDASGEERLVVFDAGGARARCRGTPATSARWSRRRSATSSPSPTIATRSGSATSRAARSSAVDTSRYGRSDDLAWSPDGAWLAYTFARRHAPRRDQAVRARERQRDLAHRARVPRLGAGVRSRRTLSLLRLGADLRSGLRQRPLRPQLPARRAALPDRAAGRRAGRRSTPSRAASAENGAAAEQGRPATATKARAADAAAHRSRRHRPPRRRVPGRREPLRPDRRRRRRQGRLERAEHRRRAWPRRPQGSGRQARALRLRDRPQRHAGREDRRLRARRRRA